MSPLLSKIARALWPETAESWGLALGAREITVCRIVRNAGSWGIAGIESEAVPEPILYKGSPVPELAERLAPVIAKVAAGAAGRYIPVCVAVPDPVVNLNVLELETLPRSATEREALARWHLEKLWPSDTTFTCQIQDMEIAGDKPRLLVAAMPRDWLDALVQACRLANIVPTVWQPAIAYSFNRFQASMRRVGHDGALLAIDTHSWSLLLWDAEGRVQYVRSRWIEVGDENQAEMIALETERTVRTYVHGGRERRLDAVHLLGDSDMAQRVAAQLNTRMQAACVTLPVFSGIDVGDEISNRHPQAAAAVSAALSACL